jgi:hypothetical protein
MSIMGGGPRNGFRVPGRSTADIRLHAIRMREVLGIAGPRFDAVRVLEDLAKYGVTVDVVDDNDPELPRGVEACWVPETVTLVIRQSVYEAAYRDEPRALFTIAHELGHLALAHRRTFNRETTRPFQVFEDSEWQANSFAGEFLMPLDQIRQQGVAEAAHLALLFGVSMQAAETRFNKLRGRGEI